MEQFVTTIPFPTSPKKTVWKIPGQPVIPPAVTNTPAKKTVWKIPSQVIPPKPNSVVVNKDEVIKEVQPKKTTWKIPVQPVTYVPTGHNSNNDYVVPVQPVPAVTPLKMSKNQLKKQRFKEKQLREKNKPAQPKAKLGHSDEEASDDDSLSYAISLPPPTKKVPFFDHNPTPLPPVKIRTPRPNTITRVDVLDGVQDFIPEIVKFVKLLSELPTMWDLYSTSANKELAVEDDIPKIEKLIKETSNKFQFILYYDGLAEDESTRPNLLYSYNVKIEYKSLNLLDYSTDLEKLTDVLAHLPWDNPWKVKITTDDGDKPARNIFTALDFPSVDIDWNCPFCDHDLKFQFVKCLWTYLKWIASQYLGRNVSEEWRAGSGIEPKPDLNTFTYFPPFLRAFVDLHMKIYHKTATLPKESFSRKLTVFQDMTRSLFLQTELVQLPMISNEPELGYDWEKHPGIRRGRWRSPIAEYYRDKSLIAIHPDCLKHQCSGYYILIEEEPHFRCESATLPLIKSKLVCAKFGPCDTESSDWLTPIYSSYDRFSCANHKNQMTTGVDEQNKILAAARLEIKTIEDFLKLIGKQCPCQHYNLLGLKHGGVDRLDIKLELRKDIIDPCLDVLRNAVILSKSCDAIKEAWESQLSLLAEKKIKAQERIIQTEKELAALTTFRLLYI